MSSSFLISDTHFSHGNIIKYCNRPFANAEEMDAELVKRWNSVVGVKDKVYHLGDVFINRKARNVIAACNGTKVLIKGNHDIFDLDHYLPHFKDIRAYHVLSNMVLSHIPIHMNQLERFNVNVHGHIHDKIMTDASGNVDMNYINVCVEHTNYTPIALDDIIKIVKDRGLDRKARGNN